MSESLGGNAVQFSGSQPLSERPSGQVSNHEVAEVYHLAQFVHHWRQAGGPTALDRYPMTPRQNRFRAIHRELCQTGVLVLGSSFLIYYSA